MITDAQTTLSDAQALTATAVSTNAYDSGGALTDIFVGTPMAVLITVDVAADFTSTNETYEFQVVASAAAALTSPTVLATRTITAANLTAGRQHIIPVPPLAKILRYVGMNYVLAGTTPTVTVTAMLLPLDQIDARLYYADNITISP